MYVFVSNIHSEVSIFFALFYKEPKLRATQYLPHIVKLQQSLFDMFNYRMDKSKAMRLSIGKFLQNLQNGLLNTYF